MFKDKINIYVFICILFSGILASYASGASDTSGVSVEGGTYNYAKMDYIGIHEDYETPYFVFKGSKTGPVMMLDGGIHGDEIASYMACDSIVKFLKLKKGTLIVIPRTNIQACTQNTRAVNFDFNHAFPGNIMAEQFEYRLAYDFMWLVDSVKPDLIINLHEARTKWSEKAKYDSEGAYGQIVITCLQPFEELLVRSVDNMNKRIPPGDFQFHTHYYSYRDHSSLDNFVAKFNIKSYTVESYRGFNIEDRVKLQIIAAITFMEEIGLEFYYPEVKF